jgi:WXG100 family type VII secretion target
VSENTVYNYDVIADCNKQFKAEIGRMHDDIDRFQSEVSKLVENTWGGAAAQEYNVAADGLNRDLDDRTTILMNLDTSLAKSAENMDHTDRQGKKNIESSV